MADTRIKPSEYYGSPEEALAPLSSNTETTICQVLCDDSVISIIPPHPTYTNGAGKEVIQMNAVLIGGNGLNG
jgi:hypothetical protein